MDLKKLDEVFYLEHSYIHNIGLSNQNKNLILTVNILNWAQKGFKKGIDPDQIVGNLIFHDVSNIDLDPETFKFDCLEVLRVNYNEKIRNKINCFIEMNSSDYLELTFLATSVEWILLETYFDRKVIT